MISDAVTLKIRYRGPNDFISHRSLLRAVISFGLAKWCSFESVVPSSSVGCNSSLKDLLPSPLW